MRDDELTMAFFLTGEMSEELEELIQLEKEEHYMRKCDAQKKSKRGERRDRTTAKAKASKQKMVDIFYSYGYKDAPLGYFKKESKKTRLSVNHWVNAQQKAAKKAARRAGKQEISEQLEEYGFTERELTLAENSWSDSDLEMLLEWEAIQAREELRTEFLILVESWLAVHDAL